MKDLYLLLNDIQGVLLNEIKNTTFKRNIFNKINWNEDSIGLIGERGVGKTTIMLQKINDNNSGFYFSADNPGILDVSLFKFIYYLHKELEIKEFYIDEIHKYPEWTNEIKSLIDSIPNVKIIFSGSSSLDLFKGVIDLGRRVSFYKIHTLNFREYLKLFYGEDIPSFSLTEILNNHEKIGLMYGNFYGEEKWNKFIKNGQYPYGKRLDNYGFNIRFKNLLDKIILEDIPIFLNMQTNSLDKIRKVFYFIANSTPSELSFTFLSKKVGIDKSIVENVLVLLNKIGLINLVPKFGDLSTRVRKEYKILLGNTNLYSAYNISTDIGILRESYILSVFNRLENSEVFLPKSGDFILNIFDDKYIFEVGGKTKNKKQIYHIKNSFIISDNIVIGEKNKIPLWLFGLIE